MGVVELTFLSKVKDVEKKVNDFMIFYFSFFLLDVCSLQ
jgi:hypothetical protein